MSFRIFIRESAETLKTVRDDLKIMATGVLRPLARMAFDACFGCGRTMLRINPSDIYFRLIKPPEPLLADRHVINVKRNDSVAAHSIIPVATKDFVNGSSSGKSVAECHVIAAKNGACVLGSGNATFWTYHGIITVGGRLDSARRVASSKNIC